MVNRFIVIIISVLAISLASIQVQALELQALRTIPAKLLFQTHIDSPSFLTDCGGWIWTFSVLQNSLYAIDSNTGASTRSFEFPGSKTKGTDVSALSCRGQRLFVLVNGEGNETKPQIYEFLVERARLKLESLKKTLFPYRGRATDLFCNPDKCWLLQGKLWVSENLRNWRDVSPPKILNIPLLHSNPVINPFEDWQSTLVLAEGKYSKGAASVTGQVSLLDPFRSQVVTQMGSDWKRWGSFGAWEGRFLAPKAILYLSKHIMAIADTKLKAIFLFNDEGQYLGLISSDEGKIFSPDYPLGLASLGSQLYLADFRANRVKALDLHDFSSKVEKPDPMNIRQNLFRRPEVLKDEASNLCLNCHDGTQSNQLFKFARGEYTHPLECAKCHDPHHQIQSLHYLNKPSEALCLSCHQNYAKPESNHVWKDRKKKGGACTDCHQAHARVPGLLLSESPQICMDCHKDKIIHHRAIENFMGIDSAKGLHFQNGKINCATCHQTHIQWRTGGFLAERDTVRIFCASCHGIKADSLYQNFHQIMKAKGKRP